MTEYGGAEVSQESLCVETDMLVLLDIDRTSFDTDAFAHAVGDLAVNSFGISREYIAQARHEAEAVPGRSFNIVSCIHRALNGEYRTFEQALLAGYEADAFTHPDALDGLQTLAAADIPVMAMTHGVELDQNLKLATSPSLGQLPVRVIEAPNKGEILKYARGDDGRYRLTAQIGGERVEYVASWIAIADDKLENFAALEPGMHVIPFYLPGRSRTRADIELKLALVEVTDLRQVADCVVRLRDLLAN